MKRTIKSESGRSMVEMLGVLAIIGVLSIGGIAGYTMAMNRYRANEVIDMANKMASLVFAQDQTARARTGAQLTDAQLADMTPTSLGLVTTAVDNADTGGIPGGGAVMVTAVADDGVTMTLSFPTAGVCTAAENIISQAGITCEAGGAAVGGTQSTQLEGVVIRQS